MFPRLGNAFLLAVTIAVVEPMSIVGPMEECCAEKMVGSVSYSLMERGFQGSIPNQCLNNCVYTVSGTSSPKFCFQRGTFMFQCCIL